MPIYWTKPIFDEETHAPTGEFEIIKEETEFPYVPDGDGFEVDMNGIAYHDYLASPESYTIEYGKLVTK